jgi:hypothetical protein
MTRFQGEQGPQGERGPKGDPGESRLVGLAEEQVNRLIKAKSVPKWWGRALTTGFLMLLVVAAFTVNGYFANQRVARQLKADSIAQCVLGNQDRAALDKLLNEAGSFQAGLTEAALGQLILPLEGPHPSAKIKAEAAALEAQIKARADKSLRKFKGLRDLALAPRDCTAAYSNATPGQSPPRSVSLDRSTWQYVELRNWNGYCLSAASASIGTPAREEPCSSAHGLWYNYATDQLTLSGHADVSFGGKGGLLVLRPAPSSRVLTNSTKAGPGGYLYDRLYFARAAYWHANGNGRGVTLTGNGNTNADYWAFLSYQASARALAVT